MFRASSCPSSGAYQLQQQPLVYRWNVVVAVLLVVVQLNFTLKELNGFGNGISRRTDNHTCINHFGCICKGADSN